MIPEAGTVEAAEPVTRLAILHGYIWVFVIAFVVTLLATPLMRRLALANGIIDHPSDPRKQHRIPVAYLGGTAVFLGLMAAILYSYVATYVMPGLIDFHPSKVVDPRNGDVHPPVPLSIVFGLFIIMLVGLLDDVLHISPRIKVAGQLVAAAALAVDNVGVQVARGVMMPLAKSLSVPLLQLPDGSQTVGFTISLPVDLPLLTGDIRVDLVYWCGTAVIAVFVLGACNAANLIDGLDGLLSGVTAIAMAGLLVIALTLAMMDDGGNFYGILQQPAPAEPFAQTAEPFKGRDAQRIVLCLALLGASLGFLPHNYRPATIFLGDCGSLLLGFGTAVVILTLGDTGKTYLVIAGLIIWAIPIVDTVLAIVRRKMAGRPMSSPDDQHLHHMLKRTMGVQGAVLTLYGIAAVFAILGVLMSVTNAKAIYVAALVLGSFLVVTAVKIARLKQIEEQTARLVARRTATHAPEADQDLLAS